MFQVSYIIIAEISSSSTGWEPCFHLLTIKELDDVREVHVVFQDDVSVHLHECESNEEHKVVRGRVLGCPDGFPHGVHVIVHHFCTEVEEVAVSITLHNLLNSIRWTIQAKVMTPAFAITSFEVE